MLSPVRLRDVYDKYMLKGALEKRKGCFPK